MTEPTIKGPHARWNTGPDRRFFAEHGYLDPYFIIYRITPGPGWWDLDDIARNLVGTERIPLADIAVDPSYNIIPKPGMDRLIAEFTRRGIQDRLEFRLLPSGDDRRWREHDNPRSIG